MKTYDIVIRLTGSRQSPKLQAGNSQDYRELTDLVRAAVKSGDADIVYKGDYFRYDSDLLPAAKEFETFVLFRQISSSDTDDTQHLWKTLENYLVDNNFLEVRENDETYQLIEFSNLENGSWHPGETITDTTEGEDVLVRISGSREEIEFDPLNDEANKMLYDRLAKQIYDRDAEIMYKGPRLDFDDNRDLFINPDDFSVYVLFRTSRDYRYEDNEMLWSNINNDLKVNSTVTLYKTPERYQVVMIREDLQ